mgnify:CR=1 FL=1
MSDLAGFTQAMIDTGELRLSVHRAGQGAPLILLHGFPQNHLCWEKVAPRLAEHFHVIVPDLRDGGEPRCRAERLPAAFPQKGVNGHVSGARHTGLIWAPNPA